MRVMVPYQASWMADFPCYVADDCKFEVKVLDVVWVREKECG